MATPTVLNPGYAPEFPLYDPVGHGIDVFLQAGTPVQDATTGIWYAPVQTTVANANNNGPTTPSNSSPVVLPIAVAVYSLPSTTTSGTTQNSGDLNISIYDEIGLDINTTAQAGTSPTIQYFYERKGADGIYYVLWQSAVLTAATNTLSTSIGKGLAYNQMPGITGRLRWVIGGSATPTFTHSLNVYGK